MDEEPKPKPYSQNIQVQYQPMYAGQMQQGYPEQQYPQGVPMGQPVQAYQQPQMTDQQQFWYKICERYYVQQPYLGQQTAQQQQLVMLAMVQPFHQKAIIEERIRQTARWFNGCNSLWGIYILINLISRSVALFGNGYSDPNFVAAGAIIIIENLIWLGSIGIGVYGMANFRERLLLFYQYGLTVVMLLEIIASIIIFASVNAGGKAFMVIFFILTLICLSLFINHARQLRAAIMIWMAMNPNDPNSQRQQ